MRFINEVALRHTGEECLIWPYAKIGNGYGGIWIDGKAAPSHRYVCQLIHGAPPTPDHEAAHNCGNLICISPIHLDWKTKVENEADKLIHGTHNRGERNWRAKLTEPEAREILAMKGIEVQHKLAKRFGVSPSTVGSIHAGLSWAWLTGAPNPSPNVVIE